MKITCNVIQDLLPSYADGTLSEDSQALVDEHLASCKECKSILEELKKTEDQYAVPRRDDAENLKKFRKKLKIRKVLTAAVSAAVTLFVVGAVWWQWYTDEHYITREESGMYVDDNRLYSAKNLIDRHKTMYTEDGKTEFVYAIDSPCLESMEPEGKEDFLIQDFNDKTDLTAPEDESTPATVKEVYYLSKEAQEKVSDLLDLTVAGKDAEVQKLIDEMKKSSELLWSGK